MDKLLIILIPESHVIEDKIVNFYFNLIFTRKRENNWPKVNVGMSLGRGPAQPGLAWALHETIFKVGLSRARPIYFGPI